jgi:putative Holliday junction resolvase
MATNAASETILALDVGERRIGVARAFLGAPFPGPLTTLDNPDTFLSDIQALCASEGAAALVLGLPRNLSGQETTQTKWVQEFGKRLESLLSIPVYWNDEAVTSIAAEAELRRRGKPYAKGDIDALAAVYILEDFIENNKHKHPELMHG